MPTIEVLYFAHVRAITGTAQESLTLPAGATAADAVAALVRRYPPLARLMASVRVALDAEFATGTELLREGAELVLIPPVAGGADAMPLVSLGPDVLDAARVDALARAVAGPHHGATVVFVGHVRDHARGHAVTSLRYEAYVPMAEKLMRRIVDAITAAYPGTAIALHHRVGDLAIGDTAVIVAVAAAHRKAAFDACQEVIDRLKADVPIWKHEHGPDGAEWVSDRP